MKTERTKAYLSPFNVFVRWLKYRKHPCYIGGGEFDHTLEVVDDSYDHDFGCEQIQYMQCEICGATHDEDATIPESPDGYFDDCDW